jgi:ketosteroid isomerase-like protein
MATGLRQQERMTIDRLNVFFNAWNRHDVERICSFFTEDGEYLASRGPDRDGTRFRGIAEVRRGVAGFLETFRAAHYTDLRMFVCEDRGAAEWTFRGRSAAGEEISYRGCDLFEFAGDKIRRKDAFRKEHADAIRPAGLTHPGVGPDDEL